MRAILTYHSIDASGSPISVDPGSFRRQIDWLARNEVRVVTLEEVLALPPGARAVALTFDDGFRNFATEAWPLLRERGLPATLFVATDHVGGTNAWEEGRGVVPVLPLLGWAELAALGAEGVTVGSHSCTHPALPDLPEARLSDELERSAARIQAETGRRPTAFAYPFGESDARAAAAVRRVYRTACTTRYRVLGGHEDPCLLPRLDAVYFRSAHRLDAWGSRTMRRRLLARAGARAARRALTRIGVIG